MFNILKSFSSYLFKNLLRNSVETAEVENFSKITKLITEQINAYPMLTT
jgi:hypothetical protein